MPLVNKYLKYKFLHAYWIVFNTKVIDIWSSFKKKTLRFEQTERDPSWKHSVFMFGRYFAVSPQTCSVYTGKHLKFSIFNDFSLYTYMRTNSICFKSSQWCH